MLMYNRFSHIGQDTKSPLVEYQQLALSGVGSQWYS